MLSRYCALALGNLASEVKNHDEIVKLDGIDALITLLKVINFLHNYTHTHTYIHTYFRMMKSNIFFEKLFFMAHFMFCLNLYILSLHSFAPSPSFLFTSIIYHIINPTNRLKIRTADDMLPLLSRISLPMPTIGFKL